MPSKNDEWSQERRNLIDLIDDLSSRLRNGCSSREATTILETAIEEAANIDGNG